MRSDQTAARSLGWASIGIGLTELLTPGKVEGMLGVRNGENTGILRALGIREIMTGIDILSHRDPTPGIWSRLAGDAVDGILMAIVGRKTRNPSGYSKALVMVLGITLLDMFLAAWLGGKRLPASRR